jgi:hypothetical protein
VVPTPEDAIVSFLRLQDSAKKKKPDNDNIRMK